MTFDRAFDAPGSFRICFVCTGNICRSPMAEIVFRDIVERNGYGDAISVMSAGTGDWHLGEKADARTIAALDARGHDGTAHRARVFNADWFSRLDLVVVFDRSQERILKAWAGSEEDQSKVALLLSFDREQASTPDVPDPYYADAALFETVLSMVERASIALFRQIKPGIRLGTP